MKSLTRIEYFELIHSVFKFKTLSDEQGNEYVLLEENSLNTIPNVKDKTEFEAVENHVHLLHNIKKQEFDRLIPVAKTLGETLSNVLKVQFPDKKFFVYVSLHLKDSMIIRFHQKWLNEEPYYNPDDFNSDIVKMFLYET